MLIKTMRTLAVSHLHISGYSSESLGYGWIHILLSAQRIKRRLVPKYSTCTRMQGLGINHQCACANHVCWNRQAQPQNQASCRKLHNWDLFWLAAVLDEPIATRPTLPFITARASASISYWCMTADRDKTTDLPSSVGRVELWNILMSMVVHMQQAGM